MQASDDLHRLIHSLSPNEKRYFKLFTTKQAAKDDKNYLLLFDILDKLSVYDEEQLKKRLKNNVPAKTLPTAKNYLHNLIMRSLRVFYAESDSTQKIFSLLQDEQIYKHKGLSDLQLKTLKKADNIAEARGLMSYHLTILQRLKGLELHLSGRPAYQITEEYQKKEKKVLQKFVRETELAHIYYTLWSQYRSDPLLNDAERIGAYNELKKSPLLRDYKSLETFKAKWYYLRCHSLLCRFNDDNKDATVYYKKMLDLFEENEQEKIDDRTEYMGAIHNYLSALHRAGEYKNFMSLIEKFRNIKATTLFEETMIFDHISNNSLLYALNTSNFGIKNEILSEINKGLKKYDGKLREQTIIGLLYNMCVMNFVTDDFMGALDIINTMLDMRAESRKDLQYGAKLFLLITHFELGNFELLESLIRNTARSLQKDNVYYSFEKMLGANLKKIMRSLPQDRIEIYRSYCEELILLRAGNPKFKFVIMDETIAWLRSKINGTTINTEIRKLLASQPHQQQT